MMTAYLADSRTNDMGRIIAPGGNPKIEKSGQLVYGNHAVYRTDQYDRGAGGALLHQNFGISRLGWRRTDRCAGS